MGKLTPAFIAASAALALASSASLAQSRVTTSQGGTAPTVSSTPGNTGTASTAPGTSGPAAGGCVGTGGSTCTAATTSPGGNATFSGPTGTATSAPTETNPNENVGGPLPGSSPEASAGTGGFSRQPDPRSLVLDPDLPFRTTPNNPDATPTGVALGRSPGHTSAGIASGPSSTGIDVSSATLGTDRVNTDLASVLPDAALAPGVTVPGITGFTGGAAVGGSGMNVNGERVGNGGADFRAGRSVAASTPTPLYDRVAAIGAAKEWQRREDDEEPRIIGIAPRTERDLTHQMPDDPIIRY